MHTSPCKAALQQLLQLAREHVRSCDTVRSAQQQLPLRQAGLRSGAQLRTGRGASLTLQAHNPMVQGIARQVELLSLLPSQAYVAGNALHWL